VCMCLSLVCVLYVCLGCLRVYVCVSMCTCCALSYLCVVLDGLGYAVLCFVLAG